ncbi:protein LAX PANICLE 2 isoform X1 [Malus domestica]|uniref:protein LAX PANICLE 2 isoform X1 n=1 Tax=Malus domestica TaxID=3750 RepID=UPI0010AA36BA|nr:protein LAX PANICLE 2 isoform X1 [Malus domestica]
MTMVPPAAHHQNIPNQQQQHNLYGGYGGCGSNYTAEISNFGLMNTSQVVEEGYEYNNYCNNIVIESDHHHHHQQQLAGIDSMAEDESRTNSVNEAGSSSKDAPEDNKTWLQLTIGGGSNNHPPATTEHPTLRSLRSSTTPSRPGLVELDLDLLPPGHDQGGFSSLRQVRSMPHMPPIFHVSQHENIFRASPSNPSFRPPFNSSNATALYFQQPGPGMSSSSSGLFPHQDVNWAFRPAIPHNNIGMMASTSSSSASSFIQLGSSYFARPFHHPLHEFNVAGPSLDFRVVDPPRRPQSGIWFTLQASQNQAKEPFLPQIPKSYLRIKDGRMTVRLIKKYLVNKLRLDSESEQVEITCRGQELLPFLTLQHVRDNIWSLRDALTLLPDSSTTDHVMVLNYARTTTMTKTTTTTTA